jgi:competence protein ComFA
MFHGQSIDPPPRVKKVVEPKLSYSLTHEQQVISDAIVQSYLQKKHVMVDAVTGSGKTEIVFQVIQYALRLGHRVAMIIPRKDVVIEMVERFSSVFPDLHIGAMYGGKHEISEDFMILTTHQIYQFERYFHLLIFDEVDAFPYAGNPVLKALVKRASIGTIVNLSATFSYEEMKQFKEEGGDVFHLHKRYHGHPLPSLLLFKTRKLYAYATLYKLVHRVLKMKLPLLIFVPTIDIGERLAFWLLPLIKGGSFVYSTGKNRQQDVQKFKKQELRYLISTSILERGITLENLQVIMYASDHPLMDEKTIIQMAGRVGRKLKSPKGEVMLIYETITDAMEASQRRIASANQTL